MFKYVYGGARLNEEFTHFDSPHTRLVSTFLLASMDWDRQNKGLESKHGT